MVMEERAKDVVIIGAGGAGLLAAERTRSLVREVQGRTDVGRQEQGEIKWPDTQLQMLSEALQ
jgi:flavin-dependent dehydrogenase